MKLLLISKVQLEIARRKSSEGKIGKEELVKVITIIRILFELKIQKYFSLYVQEMKENMALQNQAKKWIQVVKIDGLIWNIIIISCEIFLKYFMRNFVFINLDICICAVLEPLVCIFSYFFTHWLVYIRNIFIEHTNTDIRPESIYIKRDINLLKCIYFVPGKYRL